MKIKKDARLLPNARTLRKNMTPHERKLWYLFLRSYPIKIYKQRIIDHYIVDFYCPKAKLVIELDGSQHYTEQGQYADNNRSFILEKYHLTVLRFSNQEIDTEFDAVCETIDRHIQTAVNL
ncbi:MAG: endonuclease domain-containing protein [Clostridia bacterium]|nr:endonuclease domain-containing protein [Clostridia bacterium]